MPDSASRTPPGQDTIEIATLLVLAALVARAGANPTLRSSPELAELFGASEVSILDLTKNPTGAYKVSAAALQFAAVTGVVRLVGEGWLLEDARREAELLEGMKKAIASSTGNFAAAVALLAEKYKLPVDIFMPKESAVPQEKRDLVRHLGGEFAKAMHVDSPFFDDARAAAEEEARRTCDALLQPYDSALAILGNAASMVLAAMTGHVHDYDLVVVPNGGGGLSAGIFLALESMSIRAGERVCAEPATSASFTEAATRGEPAQVVGGKSLASGANVKHHGSLTWRVLARFNPTPCPATELEIAQAMLLARELTGEIWEGAAALSLVPLLRGEGRGKRILVVRSGANPSAAEIAEAERLVAENGGLEALLASLKRKLS